MEYMHRAQPLGYLVAALTSFVLLGAASAQESVSAETVAAVQTELPIAVIVPAAASGGVPATASAAPDSPTTAERVKRCQEMFRLPWGH